MAAREARPGTRDVAVLGGGPAGSAAAALLARWGHDVVLCTRPSPPAAGLAESLPPSTWKLLAAAGAREAVEAAAFLPNGGNTVWWAGRNARAAAFRDGAAGVHVERGRLEAVLQGVAEAAGVEVRRGGPVRAPARESARPRPVRGTCGGPSGAPWHLEAEGAGGDPRGEGPRTLRARWVLDATGRSGVVARRGHRVPDPETATLALVGRWRRTRGKTGARDDTRTWIESYAEGWAWSVPLARGLRCVTVMADPRWTPVEAGGRLAGTYARELARAANLTRGLRGWRPAGPVRACPAGLYTARSFAGPGLLLVGDAGSFIDPLSSYGVKKALASGWLAAVAVHTALTDESLATAALELFDTREREVYRSYRALSLPFFREAAAAHRHPYWERRARAAAAAAGNANGGGDPADAAAPLGPAGPPEAAVRAAFEELRAREELALAPSRGARWVPRPTVEGNRIVLREHLVGEGAAGGVRFVRGVDIARLVALAPHHDRVGDLHAAYGRAVAPVSLPDFLAALATALAAGALAWRT